MTFNPRPKSKPIRYYGKAKIEFRRQVYLRASGVCEKCDNPAPLYNHYGYWDWNCGDIRHIKGYGAGGGDTLDNVNWWCHSCHMKTDHSPRWSCMEENKS